MARQGEWRKKRWVRGLAERSEKYQTKSNLIKIPYYVRFSLLNLKFAFNSHFNGFTGKKSKE